MATVAFLSLVTDQRWAVCERHTFAFFTFSKAMMRQNWCGGGTAGGLWEPLSQVTS